MIKITLFFEHGPYGWSESHYLSSPSAQLSDGVAAATTIAPIRGALLGSGFTDTQTGVVLPQPYLHYIRVSDTTKPRLVQFVTGPGRSLGEVYYVGNFASDSSGAADFQNNSLRVSAFGQNGVQSIDYLGGIPRGLNPSGRSVVFGDVTGWNKAWTQWQKAITSGTLGFLCKNKAVDKSTIVNVQLENVNPGRLIISFLAPPNPQFANKLQISGAVMASRAFKPLNGVYRIAAISTTTPVNGAINVTLADTYGRDPTQISFPGFVQVVTPAVTAYQAGQYLAIGLSSRKRGVPYKSPHGRRRPAKQYAP